MPDSSTRARCATMEPPSAGAAASRVRRRRLRTPASHLSATAVSTGAESFFQMPQRSAGDRTTTFRRASRGAISRSLPSAPVHGIRAQSERTDRPSVGAIRVTAEPTRHSTSNSPRSAPETNSPALSTWQALLSAGAATATARPRRLSVNGSPPSAAATHTRAGFTSTVPSPAGAGTTTTRHRLPVGSSSPSAAVGSTHARSAATVLPSVGERTPSSMSRPLPSGRKSSAPLPAATPTPARFACWTASLSAGAAIGSIKRGLRSRQAPPRRPRAQPQRHAQQRPRLPGHRSRPAGQG